ncbi:hypothetical protein TSOC_002659 [Tetrabaena socialis]|uniref:Rieske-like [2Fe-2S] domain-containing protein n=1 Tax=Tetrabaena socialis TaxID=47790 RepID=A0A2J8ADL5_9CHLO|nr:hypothetical protein TSOC_002659 [Tetrabaena socialis]|eukprot:PNH10611.1 hypothetical protein TSOC_002659 [Tetrabaena socialis]
MEARQLRQLRWAREAAEVEAAEAAKGGPRQLRWAREEAEVEAAKVAKMEAARQLSQQTHRAVKPSGKPAVVAGLGALPLQPVFRCASANRSARRVADVGRLRATEESVEVKPLASTSTAVDTANWVPTMRPEDLPKGVRKEVDVEDRQVLMFWYRNQIYCIESRSPAEGAYSEGFIKAKFTQDYCIECPATGSLFSLKDGSIKSWYPNNPVLRALTPAELCRPMEIYPVKLTQEAIYVDVTAGALGGVRSARGRGGAGTSVENNNIFTVQPTVYFEGMDPTKESASVYADVTAPAAINPVVVLAGVLAVGAVAVAGTAFAIYYENLNALIAFWAVFGVAVGTAGFTYVNKQFKGDAKN